MPTTSFLTAYAEQVRTRPGGPALSWRGEVVSYATLDRLPMTRNGKVDPGG